MRASAFVLRNRSPRSVFVDARTSPHELKPLPLLDKKPLLDTLASERKRLISKKQ